MRHSRGNILFLILLAVMLFAALAYAVTSSIRGGGKDASSENAELKASQILQYMSLLESSIMRLQMTGDYKQVTFSKNAANAAGTVYWGSAITTTGKTVGLFNDTDGAMSNVPVPPNSVYSDAYVPSTLLTVRVMLEPGGGHMGTTAADVVMYTESLTLAVCQAINAKLGVTVTDYVTSIDTSAPGFSYPVWIYNHGTGAFVFTPVNSTSSHPALPAQRGCFPSGANNPIKLRYWQVLEVR